MLGPLGAELRCVHLKSKEIKGTPPQDSKKEAMLTQGTLVCHWKEMHVCECVCVCTCAHAHASEWYMHPGITALPVGSGSKFQG